MYVVETGIGDNSSPAKVTRTAREYGTWVQERHIENLVPDHHVEILRRLELIEETIGAVVKIVDEIQGNIGVVVKIVDEILHPEGLS